MLPNCILSARLMDQSDSPTACSQADFFSAIVSTLNINALEGWDFLTTLYRTQQQHNCDFSHEQLLTALSRDLTFLLRQLIDEYDLHFAKIFVRELSQSLSTRMMNPLEQAGFETFQNDLFSAFIKLVCTTANFSGSYTVVHHNLCSDDEFIAEEGKHDFTTQKALFETALEFVTATTYEPCKSTLILIRKLLLALSIVSSNTASIRPLESFMYMANTLNNTKITNEGATHMRMLYSKFLFHLESNTQIVAAVCKHLDAIMLGCSTQSAQDDYIGDLFGEMLLDHLVGLASVSILTAQNFEFSTVQRLYQDDTSDVANEQDDLVYHTVHYVSQLMYILSFKQVVAACVAHADHATLVRQILDHMHRNIVHSRSWPSLQLLHQLNGHLRSNCKSRNPDIVDYSILNFCMFLKMLMQTPHKALVIRHPLITKMVHKSYPSNHHSSCVLPEVCLEMRKAVNEYERKVSCAILISLHYKNLDAAHLFAQMIAGATLLHAEQFPPRVHEKLEQMLSNHILIDLFTEKQEMMFLIYKTLASNKASPILTKYMQRLDYENLVNWIWHFTTLQSFRRKQVATLREAFALFSLSKIHGFLEFCIETNECRETIKAFLSVLPQSLLCRYLSSKVLTKVQKGRCHSVAQTFVNQRFQVMPDFEDLIHNMVITFIESKDLLFAQPCKMTTRKKSSRPVTNPY